VYSWRHRGACCFLFEAVAVRCFPASDAAAGLGRGADGAATGMDAGAAAGLGRFARGSTPGSSSGALSGSSPRAADTGRRCPSVNDVLKQTARKQVRREPVS
jgi:hypothetical protein